MRFLAFFASKMDSTKDFGRNQLDSTSFLNALFQLHFNENVIQPYH
jgi:hypothetical protein